MDRELDGKPTWSLWSRCGQAMVNENTDSGRHLLYLTIDPILYKKKYSYIDIYIRYARMFVWSVRPANVGRSL
jgi:hypothetical protein